MLLWWEGWQGGLPPAPSSVLGLNHSFMDWFGWGGFKKSFISNTPTLDRWRGAERSPGHGMESGIDAYSSQGVKPEGMICQQLALGYSWAAGLLLRSSCWGQAGAPSLEGSKTQEVACPSLA